MFSFETLEFETQHLARMWCRPGLRAIRHQVW